MMCLYFILTVGFHSTIGSLNYAKRHVPNSLIPQQYEIPTYDIGAWVQVLNLQHCTIVEVGENYCALFVESNGGPSPDPKADVKEYFLGLCDCQTLTQWKFCSPWVEKERSGDCRITNTDLMKERVHRRLCDVTGLAAWASSCNCSNTMAYAPLLKVSGFPTCFQPPLPQSLCSPRNVCGVAKCNASTVADKIHTASCSKSCLGHRPFCETSSYDTSEYRRESSFWSDWSPVSCNAECGLGRLEAQAVCINKDTGEPATDCLGPGTHCCPPDTPHCICRVFMENGSLKVMRTLTTCISRRACDASDGSGETVDSFIEVGRYKQKQKHAKNYWEQPKRRRVRKYKPPEKYIEDDNEDDDDNEEDIAIEEDEEEVDKSNPTKDESDEIKTRDDIEKNMEKMNVQIKKNILKEEENENQNAKIESENGEVLYGITVSSAICIICEQFSLFLNVVFLVLIR